MDRRRLLLLLAVCGLLASASASGGGGGSGAEHSFLTTPTFVLATMFAFFLVCTLLFQHGTHKLIHYFHKLKRDGLANAVEHLVEELTAIGFISLVLIALQGPFESICVSYSSSVLSSWTYLDRVQGCDCCLSHTAGVDRCFQYQRQCGPYYCNCDAQDPQCLVDVPEGSLNAKLATLSDRYNCTCPAEDLLHVLEILEVDAASLDVHCEGLIGSGSCPVGKVPFITANTLHQVHIFLFVVAMTHVTMGVVMILVASLRLTAWRRWPDDELQRSVRDENDETLDRDIASIKARHHRRGLRDHLHVHRVKRRSHSALPPPPPTSGAVSPVAGRLSSDVEAGRAAGTSFRTANSGSFGAAPAGASAASPEAQAEAAASNGAAAALGNGSAAVQPLASGLQEDGGPPRDPGDTWRAGSPRPWGGRHGRLAEFLLCIVYSFHPQPVSHSEFSLMRASFLKSHEVPSSFDFMNYIELSLQDDYSHVVGISLLEWGAMVVSVLLAGPIGWPAMIFLILAAVMQIVVNAKLVQIIRHVCRGGRVNQLASNIFWRGKPSLLLIPIRFNLFLTSFIFSSALFFLWQFGSQSCFFTSHGNAFWLAWVGPWWTSLIYAGAMLFNLSARTLPMYSLAVQMGSNFKHHMLPKGIQDKLLRIVGDVRERHRKEKEAQKAQERSQQGAGDRR